LIGLIRIDFLFTPFEGIIYPCTLLILVRLCAPVGLHFDRFRVMQGRNKISKGSAHKRWSCLFILTLGIVLSFNAYLFAPYGDEKPSWLLSDGFRYEKVVVLVAFDRFEYFQTVLSSLISADDSSSYTLIVAVDGLKTNQSNEVVVGRERIINALDSVSKAGHFVDVMVDVSELNLGVWKNKKRGVSLGFNRSDFVIVLEDDITIAQDGLRWFEWHVTSGLIFRNRELATASCWSASFTLSKGLDTKPSDTFFSQELQLQHRWMYSSWAHQWGWAIWRSTWDKVGENWTGQDQDLARAIQARGLFETHPMLARCNNIGAFGVNKQGLLSSHVHARSLTSGSVGISLPSSYLGPCSPKLVSGQTLQNITPPILYKWLRGGIGAHTVDRNISLEESRSRIEFVRRVSTAWDPISCEGKSY